MVTTPPQLPEFAVPGKPAKPPRKRRRIFMWSFLALQALFVAWIIVAIATAHNGPDLATVHRGCDAGAWQGLFKSHADCMTHYASGLQQAGDAGTAIGIGLVIGLWVAADVILGIGRLVVVLARRKS
jgi:hypothetical protein